MNQIGVVLFPFLSFFLSFFFLLILATFIFNCCKESEGEEEQEEEQEGGEERRGVGGGKQEGKEGMGNSVVSCAISPTYPCRRCADRFRARRHSTTQTRTHPPTHTLKRRRGGWYGKHRGKT